MLMMMLVVMLVMVLVVMMLMVMMLVAALARIVVVMMVLMLLMVMMMVLVIMIVVMLVAALALVVVVVLMVMLVVMMLMIMMVLVIMMLVAAFALFVIVVMMLVIVVGMSAGGADILDVEQAFGRLDGLQQLGGLELVPRGGDDAGLFVVAAQEGDALVQTVLGDVLGTAQHDGLGAFDLVKEEFAEVLGVHAALVHVRNGGAAGQLHIALFGNLVYDAADIGQLAHAGGLDQDAVGRVGFDQLDQGLVEVAHQRAADAAGIQLGDLNAGILHEAAVDADFAVFVFKQHDLFAFERAAEQLLDQRGLARAEEAGNDVDFRHGDVPPDICSAKEYRARHGRPILHYCAHCSTCRLRLLPYYVQKMGTICTNCLTNRAK